MSNTLQICVIPDDLKERLRKFRFSKSTTMDAIIVKIEKNTKLMKIDAEMDDCTVEEICSELPEQQPRFILLSYVMKHADGRVSYPMCMIFYSPAGCNPELQMMYAGSHNSLVTECDLTKHFEIRDLEDLTQEYVDSKVC